jgi:hypothetical protein
MCDVISFSSYTLNVLYENTIVFFFQYTSTDVSVQEVYVPVILYTTMRY